MRKVVMIVWKRYWEYSRLPKRLGSGLLARYQEMDMKVMYPWPNSVYFLIFGMSGEVRQ